jgi:hypothetical protein
MSLLEATEIAHQRCLEEGFPKGSTGYDSMFYIIVEILWLNKFKRN